MPITIMPEDAHRFVERDLPAAGRLGQPVGQRLQLDPQFVRFHDGESGRDVGQLAGVPDQVVGTSPQPAPVVIDGRVGEDAPR